MCDPSSGGMGNKLNIAKKIFKKTIVAKTDARAGLVAIIGRKRRAKPNTKAIAKFDPGPAKLTKAGPHF